MTGKLYASNCVDGTGGLGHLYRCGDHSGQRLRTGTTSPAVPAANQFLLGSYVSPMLSPQTQTGDSVEPRQLHHSISSPGAR